MAATGSIKRMADWQLRKLMVRCAAVMNEPSAETLNEIVEMVGETSIPCPLDRFLNLETGECRHIAQRFYNDALKLFIVKTEERTLRQAWHLNHPMKKLTDEEFRELENCERMILNYEAIDNPTYRDENARVEADRARKRIKELRGEYPGNYHNKI